MDLWTYVTAKNMAQSRGGTRSTNPQISFWGFRPAEASKQESPHEGLQGSVSRDMDQSREWEWGRGKRERRLRSPDQILKLLQCFGQETLRHWPRAVAGEREMLGTHYRSSRRQD